MAGEEHRRTVDGGETPAVRTVMRAKDVVDAYARWAPVYDLVFGPVMEASRKAAVAALPPGARRVLEVGVGTGISLPDYPAATRVVGIDLSPDMLERARRRVADRRLQNVEAILEMDAGRLAFPESGFDAAMAMYVMTVVPDPARVMAEMRRVVKPGGRILVLSHFAADRGPRRAVGALLSPLGRLLGWNTTISAATLAAMPGTRLLSDTPAGLGGFYRLLTFEVLKDPA
jgi:phosphatidylethanolamine/phosphatidyl-N-methylethanolamine N-methyltransferase